VGCLGRDEREHLCAPTNLDPQGRNLTEPAFFRPLSLIVDLGSIAYGAIALAGLIPDEYLFKDYGDPIFLAWNGSFLLLYPFWFLPDLVQDSNKELRMDAPGGRR